MPDNIDKTRLERTGVLTFTGSGVDTIPDVMEENIDLRQQIQDMINDALANVTGATVLQDVPDQITYQFGGGGVSRSEMNSLYSSLSDLLFDAYNALWKQIIRLNRRLSREAADFQQQIDDLQSGTAVPRVLCRAYLSGNQVLADANEYIVELDTESYDPQSVFDTANNRIRIPSDGYYLFTSQLYFTSTTASGRHKSILAIPPGGGNIVSTIRYSDANTTSAFYVNFTDVLLLSEGDLIALYVSGPTGGGTTLGSNPATTWLAMAKIGNVQ